MTIHRRCRRRLIEKSVASALMLLVTTACGRATAPSSTPTRSPSPSPSPVASPIRVVYNGVGDSSEGRLRLHEELTAVGDKHVRVSFTETGMAPMLFVYDGQRMLVHDPEEFRPWILYDAPEEHPNQFAMVSHVFDGPGSADFDKNCHNGKAVGQKRILRRSAVGYHCAARHYADGSSESGGIEWFDRETGLLLQAGPIHAVSLDVHPTITGSTFSTDPPAGVKVEHWAAWPQGKRAPGFHVKRLDAAGSVSLADYANRPVVLAFFTADVYYDPSGEECRRCLSTLLEVRRLRSDGHEPAVLGMLVGEQGTPALPLIPHALDIPVGGDASFDVALSYGLESRVAFVFIGSDGRVNQLFDRVPSETELKAAVADLK